MRFGELGKAYEDGERIMRQGETGEAMYVIQSGTVEVVIEGPGGDTRLSVLAPGDIFGEMALFTGEPRSATVRALGSARILTIDKRGFLRRIHSDPSLAFRILQAMSERIRGLDSEVARLRTDSATSSPPA